jgi:protein HOOK3
VSSAQAGWAHVRYRHAADKLQKSENVIEKYKKKLEDSAGLRRELRVSHAVRKHLIER